MVIIESNFVNVISQISAYNTYSSNIVLNEVLCQYFGIE